MLHDILFSLWFLLPAAAANVAPVISAALPMLKQWDAPIDGGRKFHGKPLLGPHKTWRGLLSGIPLAVLTLWLQKLAVSHYAWAQTISRGVDYHTLPTILLGSLFGLGALGGDAIKSFFKRRRGIVSGGTWMPFDQLDYIIGAVLVSLPFVVLHWSLYIYIGILWFFMHLAATYVGWRVGLKQQPI